MSIISETDLILNPDGSVYHLNLLPGDISDTIITVGDPDRVHLITQFFDHVEFGKNKREFVTRVGSYKGKRITVISTGIGTDNIEIFFSEIDALFNIDLKTREPKSIHNKIKVIRIGTSGALQDDIPVDSYLVSDYGIGFDNLMNFYNIPFTDLEKTVGEKIQEHAGLFFTPYVVKGSEELKRQLGSGMISGNTVTCPGFYGPQGRTLRKPNLYPNLLKDLNQFHDEGFRLSNLEMETSGYYAMARLLGHEALSLNAILANRVKNTFSQNPEKVIEQLIQTVLDRL